MAKKKVKSPNKKDDEKLFAFLASFFTIIGFIIALILKRENKYVMFYARHGLVLFIGQVILGAMGTVRLVGWSGFVFILWVLWIILWVITWINALSGEQRETWLIGELAEKIKL